MERVHAVAAASGEVRVDRRVGGHVRVVVSGALDALAADALGDAFTTLLADPPSRLRLDLSAVTAVSPAGVRTLAQCLLLGRRFDEGVTVSVVSEAGRRALLDSMVHV